jgi:transposase
VAERFTDASVHKTIAVDLALITSDDALRKDLELSLLQTARHHDPHTLSLLQTVPGIGKMFSLVLLSAIHHINRFPSVQACASSCRLVTCRKASGGKRLGTAGKNIGHAHLTWAFAEAATVFVRNNPQAQKLLARLEKQHDKGKALSILAHTLGRAVYCMLKRQVAFAMHRFLHTSGSRAAEPGASLDTTGRSLKRACAKPSSAASLHAKARLGHQSLRPMR